MFSYYSGLIALRKAHPAFRMGDADMVRRHLEFLDAPKGVVAFRLKDNAGGDSWKDITVILNSNKKVEEISVPESEYTAVVKDGKVDSRGLATFSGTRIHVAPQTAMILH